MVEEVRREEEAADETHPEEIYVARLPLKEKVRFVFFQACALFSFLLASQNTGARMSVTPFTT